MGEVLFFGFIAAYLYDPFYRFGRLFYTAVRVLVRKWTTTKEKKEVYNASNAALDRRLQLIEQIEPIVKGGGYLFSCFYECESDVVVLEKDGEKYFCYMEFANTGKLLRIIEAEERFVLGEEDNPLTDEQKKERLKKTLELEMQATHRLRYLESVAIHLMDGTTEFDILEYAGTEGAFMSFEEFTATFSKLKYEALQELLMEQFASYEPEIEASGPTLYITPHALPVVEEDNREVVVIDEF